MWKHSIFRGFAEVRRAGFGKSQNRFSTGENIIERCYYGHGTLKNKVFGFRVQDFFDPHFWLGEPRRTLGEPRRTLGGMFNFVVLAISGHNFHN